jgi:hypothetical protein
VSILLRTSNRTGRTVQHAETTAVMMGGVSETSDPLGAAPEVVPSQRRLRLTSVLPVWVLAVVGSVLVLLLTQKDSFAWLLLVFVAAVFVSFVLQLATQTKDGLVERISTAASGAFVVVLVTAVVLLVR